MCYQNILSTQVSLVDQNNLLQLLLNVPSGGLIKKNFYLWMVENSWNQLILNCGLYIWRDILQINNTLIFQMRLKLVWRKESYDW